MPTIREFEKKAAKTAPKGAAKGKAAKAEAAPKGKAPARKRRPGRDVAAPSNESQGEALMHDNEQKPASAGSTDTPPTAAPGMSGGFSADAETGPLPNREESREERTAPGGFQAEADEKLRLEFTGSEYLRLKAPKAFELVETVADEWVKDGRFEGLPVGHPVAQIAAQAALLQAKKIEKRLEEKGVFALAKMGVAYAKSKLGRR